MKILMRNQRDKEWRVASSVRPAREIELQQLLVANPSLVPIEEIRNGSSPLVLAVDEFELPSNGTVDILAFNTLGDIAIIECKLAANPESKRKVIGQVLEYASYLWQWTYTDLNAQIERLKGKSLVTLIEERADETWDEEVFRQNIDACLKQGSFVLVIAVDEINDGLRQTIRYVNECSKSTFSLFALELKMFRTEQVEILIPRLYGTSAKASKITGISLTREEFLQEVERENGSAVAAVVRALLDWSEKVAHRVAWYKSSFAFKLRLENSKEFSVFLVYYSGTMELSFGPMLNNIGEELVRQFHARLREIEAFRSIPMEKFPKIALADAFGEPTDLHKFQEAVEWLKRSIPGCSANAVT